MIHYEQMVDWVSNIFGPEKDIIGCEIGVLEGRMEQILLDAFPRLFMYGVDILERGFVYPRYEFIWAHSDEACKRFKNPASPVALDFVYIDGCHLYEQVKKDILNYAPLVKEDGFIGGHDYIPDSGKDDGVKPAVDELFGNGKVRFGADYTWYILKKDIKW